MTIDAHVHIWNLERGHYDWPDASVPQIHRTMSVGDLAPDLDRFGIDGVVLVQAADTAVDTALMLEVAESDPRVRGVVGWADLAADPVAFAPVFDDLRRNGRIVGLRNLMHVKGVPQWILGARQLENVAHVAASGLPLDVVTSTHAELPDIAEVIERVRDARVVVDHLGKPPVGGSESARREWRAMLGDIASESTATAKISGLSSSVGPLDAWTPEQVRPFIEDALALFGPHRLMYGGDWPVVVLAGGYERAWNAVADSLNGLEDAERAAVLGGTAARVYGL